jgi:hypothetical protein
MTLCKGHDLSSRRLRAASFRWETWNAVGYYGSATQNSITTWRPTVERKRKRPRIIGIMGNHSL